MSFQTVFKRYELKYIITNEQKNAVLAAINPYIYPDKYGKTTVRNLYFDTESYLLIRRSIEKPTVFKEKIRIRSYSDVNDNTTVFIELKRKYRDLVYKRRLPLNYSAALNWICSKYAPKDNSQIAKEIDYFINHYQSLRPSALLFYDREAYYSKERADFRITFDSNVMAKCDNPSLEDGLMGEKILPKNEILMEIKCGGGMPLWMVSVLSKNRIYKMPFSKYGTAYKNIILGGK